MILLWWICVFGFAVFRFVLLVTCFVFWVSGALQVYLSDSWVLAVGCVRRCLDFIVARVGAIRNFGVFLWCVGFWFYVICVVVCSCWFGISICG